jgi:hypothetical protein
MQKIVPDIVLSLGYAGTQADDTQFSANLHASFTTKLASPAINSWPGMIISKVSVAGGMKCE